MLTASVSCCFATLCKFVAGNATNNPIVHIHNPTIILPTKIISLELPDMIKAPATGPAADAIQVNEKNQLARVERSSQLTPVMALNNPGRRTELTAKPVTKKAPQRYSCHSWRLLRMAVSSSGKRITPPAQVNTKQGAIKAKVDT